LLKRQSKDDLANQLQAAWGGCEDIAIQTMPTPHHRLYQGLGEYAATQAACTPQRTAHRLWWTASFSSLTRGLEAGTPREEAYTDGLNDATDSAATDTAMLDTTTPHAWQHFPAGARYGTLLHDLLQYQAEQAWPLAQVAEQDTAWLALLQRKADWLQLANEEQALLQPWLSRICLSPPAFACRRCAPPNTW
jgi:exodeoxyribonuclease V beta subunit